jgi:DNA adenine methylase
MTYQEKYNDLSNLKCNYCGYKSNLEDFDLDEYDQGFWCPDCDAYNYFSNITHRHKFSLILEGLSGKDLHNYKSRIKLDKRISPLRYPGGKSKIAEYIYTKINFESIDTFVEPFAGGASVGLALLQSRVINKLVLNDLDYGVFSLFKIITEDPELLIKRILACVPTHKDYFNAQKIIMNNYKGSNNLQAAWAMLVVNRLAYSGIVKANPLGGKNGSQAKLLQRWNQKDLIKRIFKINSMGEKIQILNIDACSLIEKLYWDSAATIFIDPPYYKKGQQLYQYYYKESDHIHLAWLLDSLFTGCPGADIILTYDNAPFIENLYWYPNIEKVTRDYSIHPYKGEKYK